MDAQVQVAGQITSKPTANGGTKFDVPLSNGMKASTFDAALATKVSQLGATVFTARLESKPNPRGGNPFINLLAAAGPGEALPPELPVAGTPVGAVPFTPGVAPAAAPASFGPATPIVAAPTGGSGNWDEATTTRVSKLAAYERSVVAVGSLFHGAGPEHFEDMVEKIDQLSRRIYIAARSHEPGTAPVAAPLVAADPASQIAVDPQAVAAFVAAEAGTAVVQVGADGIAPAVEAALPWTS